MAWILNAVGELFGAHNGDIYHIRSTRVQLQTALHEGINPNIKCLEIDAPYRPFSISDDTARALVRKAIQDVPHLRGIVVANKGLKQVPEEIAELKDLEEVMFYKNMLTQLPIQLCMLDHLRVLWLHNNNITELPAELVNLSHLMQLFLQNNQLTRFADTGVNQGGLPVHHLRIDTRTTNVVTWIPVFPNLIELNMCNNRINDVGAYFLLRTFQRHPTLMLLDLYHNRIEDSGCGHVTVLTLSAPHLHTVLDRNPGYVSVSPNVQYRTSYPDVQRAILWKLRDAKLAQEISGQTAPYFGGMKLAF